MRLIAVRGYRFLTHIARPIALGLTSAILTVSVNMTEGSDPNFEEGSDPNSDTYSRIPSLPPPPSPASISLSGTGPGGMYYTACCQMDPLSQVWINAAGEAGRTQPFCPTYRRQ